MRARDSYGNLPGHVNNNPMLDASVYEVELGDGTIVMFAADVIAESMYAQCDAEETAILRETVCVNGCNCGPSCCLDESAVIRC